MNQAFAATATQLPLWEMLIGGLVAFLSPCVLPMLPVYALYRVGDQADAQNSKAAWISLLWRALGLLIGFVTLFTFIGAGAGFIGGVLEGIDRNTLNLSIGVLMIVFGLWTAGILRLKGFKTPAWASRSTVKPTTFLRSILFGLVIALSWTPCITPVLTNAVILAGSNATAGAGMISLAVFALGLALPMVVFMVLYQWLKGALTWLRSHQPLLRRIGGILMIAYGVWMVATAVL